MNLEQRVKAFYNHMEKMLRDLDKVIYQHEVNISNIGKQPYFTKGESEIIKSSKDLLKELRQRRNTLILIQSQYKKQFITKEENRVFEYLKGLYDKGELTTKELNESLKSESITVNGFLKIKAYITQQNKGE